MAMHKKNGKAMNGGMKKHNKKHQENNGLTPAQRKLPKALQMAILKKKKGK